MLRIKVKIPRDNSLTAAVTIINQTLGVNLLTTRRILAMREKSSVFRVLRLGLWFLNVELSWPTTEKRTS